MMSASWLLEMPMACAAPWLKIMSAGFGKFQRAGDGFRRGLKKHSAHRFRAAHAYGLIGAVPFQFQPDRAGQIDFGNDLGDAGQLFPAADILRGDDFFAG